MDDVFEEMMAYAEKLTCKKFRLISKKVKVIQKQFGLSLP